MHTRRLILFATFLALTGCIPNAARKNARIESGFDFDFTAAANMAMSEKGSGVKGLPFAEIDLQGGKRKENNFGMAAQLKIPITLIYTSLDIYIELPSTYPWYYGAGVELGVFLGPYFSVTRYLDDSFYSTLTTRALLSSGTDSDRASSATIAINPQISLGVEKGVMDISAFLSYAYFTKEGVNVKTCMEDCSDDMRHHLLMLGISTRF